MSLAQLQQLLPLPEEDLRQVLDYASTLSKPEAASHFANLLGDSPLAIEFIASFNGRRDVVSNTSNATASTSAAVAPTESPDAVPKSTKTHTKKKKPQIHTPQARMVEEYAAPSWTVYNKKERELDYIPTRASAPSSNDVSRSNTPRLGGGGQGPSQPPPAQPPKQQQPAKQHASSAGFLISDIPTSKSKAKSAQSSRSSTPKPGASGGSGNNSSTKISMTGGMPMAGQATALADLDAAIRALEITTNPKLDDTKSRKCNCVATRHPLQTAAPNCLSCGKVICLKEGLGPCTYCGAPLLNPDEVQAMVRELRNERGKEKMAVDAKAHRRADVSKTPAPFTQPRGNDTGSGGPDLSDAAVKAREHRDKLLGFQAQNARRTTVRDEAADFDVGGAVMGGGGGSMWASPEERARELKRQQKLLREMEWNARPEYEKRRQIVSIDLVGGKVVRKMADVERPASPPSEDEEVTTDNYASAAGQGLSSSSGGAPPLGETSGNRGGAFSGNPLLGSLIKPVFEAKEGEGEVQVQGRRERKKWRRVQDDLDDNEDVILDGGIYGYGGRGGGGKGGGVVVGDEPECG